MGIKIHSKKVAAELAASIKRGDQICRSQVDDLVWDCLQASGQFSPFLLTGADDQLVFTGDKQLLLEHTESYFKQESDIVREKNFTKTKDVFVIISATVGLLGLALTIILNWDKLVSLFEQYSN